jgi:tetratricopeptide (TPR) repeat protein
VKLHAFVAMPFGQKDGPDGQPIDFNRIYAEYIQPGLQAAGLAVFRADEEQAAGDIRSDMFQELLIADLVLADLTIDNPNVWYELGVRHALRARGVVLVQGPRAGTPFDIYTDRKLRYHLKDGVPDPDFLAADIARLAEMARATLASWQGRKISPVYRLLDNLQEPDWKQLKLGDAREFWARHAAWEKQVKTAQRSKRPGDVLVLAEETPVVALRADAWLAAGEALLAMEHYKLALEAFDACLAAEPGHRKAGHKRGVCLQRLGALDEARDHYRQLLAAQPQDAEAWALLGRVDKDAWVAAWRRPGATRAQMADDAGYEDALLSAAINSYRSGFRADANHYYSGVNAATLMCLFQHLTQRQDHDAELTTLLGGVRWSAFSDLARAPNYWAAVTLADLEVLSGTPQRVASAYKEAIRLLENDWFSLNASREALGLLRDLGFRPDQVDAAIATFERALSRLAPPHQDWQPRQVVLFSGHIVDAPDRPTPRFPPAKVDAAARRIAEELARLGAGPEDLAITQGAAGGDLLFAEAALDLGMQLQLLQPFEQARFLQASVAPSGQAWQQRYDAVVARLAPARPILSAPQALGPAPADVDPYARCNLWLLNTALAAGIDRVRMIALWDGAKGDGPGGTEHMVSEVKRRTGRTVVIDTQGLQG